MMSVIEKRFLEYNYPLLQNNTIIPQDNTTLFICSGMQQLKSKFKNPDNSKSGSVQSCIRTNDIELIGDGSHLTHFNMIGNFSFGLSNYEESVELWHNIICDLGLRRSITTITYHPDRDDMREFWTNRGYKTHQDENCVWSDGDVYGYCTEMYVGSLEIGNLVNPLNHSTDVGFGLERLVQVIEGTPRVDETSLFRQDVHPIVRDHIRTIKLLYDNKIEPGNKGRNYVCRRLIRRIIPFISNEKFEFSDWIKSEIEQRQKCLSIFKTKYNKFKDRDDTFWWETFGILPEELNLFKENRNNSI